MEQYEHLLEEVKGVQRKTLLGSGGSGRVYLMKTIKTGDPVAVKFVPWKDKSVANAALKEGQVLLNTKHDNVLGYKGVFLHFDDATGEDLVCIISEFCDGGSLTDVLSEDERASKFEARIDTPTLFSQIAGGVNFLHEHSIIHRDLKPANIFLSNTSEGKLVAKIGDIGLGKIMDHSTASTIGGTPMFMAPEMQDKSYTRAVDIFGLGLCFLATLTKSPKMSFFFVLPFSLCERKNAQFQSTIVSQLKRAKKEEYTDLILAMTALAPENRPTSKEVLEILEKMKNKPQEQKEEINLDLKRRSLRSVSASNSHLFDRPVPPVPMHERIQRYSSKKVVSTALVKYKYTAQQDDELSILPGDIINIYDGKVGKWFRGENQKGEFGLFPSNHVEFVD